MLGVIAVVLAVVCKRMQQRPTTLGPAVHRGKDTTHKTLETKCNARAWPRKFWKSCANESNIVALRFGDHGTKEMLEVVGSNVLLRTNSQQHVRGCANGRNMQQPTMLRPFAQGLSTRCDSNFPPHCYEK